MSISVVDISKVFGTQTAVNNISLQINKGEIVGFLGPNGAGKSTTMKMITGFLAPTSGSIEVCGLNLSDNELEYKKRIGYLPESNPLYYEMYVREYLKFCAQIYKINQPAARIEEMIKLTGLTPEAHKKIGALSKGYKQRVGIAQAMLHDPEVLILDEPTSGLDPNQIKEIRDLIMTIGKEKTVLLSTHIMQEVQAMCQRVIVINRGDIVADASISEIRNMGRENNITLKSTNNLSASLFTSLSHVKISEISKNELKFTCDDVEKTRKQIMSICVANDLDISHIGAEEKNLEDIFSSLTQNSPAIKNIETSKA